MLGNFFRPEVEHWPVEMSIVKAVRARLIDNEAIARFLIINMPIRTLIDIIIKDSPRPYQ